MRSPARFERTTAIREMRAVRALCQGTGSVVPIANLLRPASAAEAIAFLEVLAMLKAVILQRRSAQLNRALTRSLHQDNSEIQV